MNLAEVARRIGGELTGDGNRAITGVRPFDLATAEDLTFLDSKNAAMLAALPACRAGAVITGRSVELPAGLNAIRIEPPHLGLARALSFLYPRRRPRMGVSPAAHLGQDVQVGEGANIYPGAYLGDHVRVGAGTDIFPGVYVGPHSVIGSDCIIYSNTTIYENCSVGDRVTIHSGAVIGADGFGYTQEPTGDRREPVRHMKIPQIGTVRIEDDVEIGANTTIDRATLAATVIGRGCKIDNLVQIAHNCTIGRHTVIAAQVGIAGSATLGDYVTIAGQAGLVGHIRVGNQAVIAGQAGVTKDVEDGQKVIGAPAMDLHEGRLAYGLISRLPELKRSISDLLKRVESLESRGEAAR